MRKNYDVIGLPPRKVKGRYPKGMGLNKVTRVKGRPPVMGDRLFHDERAVWLRPTSRGAAVTKADLIKRRLED